MSACLFRYVTRSLLMRCSQRGEWGGAVSETGACSTLPRRLGFALLVVADKNLRYQQNLSKRGIAILELWTNHRPTLEKYIDSIRAAVDSTSPGEYLQLEEPGA